MDRALDLRTIFFAVSAILFLVAAWVGNGKMSTAGLVFLALGHLFS